MYNQTTNEWFKEYKIEREIRKKKEKSEMEQLYIDIYHYNAIACEIDIDYSKKHINKENYNKQRLENKNKYINSYFKSIDINRKIENKISINKQISNFEQMFLNEFKECQNNYVKDVIIFLSTK